MFSFWFGHSSRFLLHRITKSTLLFSLCLRTCSYSSSSFPSQKLFTTMTQPNQISYVNAETAKLIDEKLMNQPGFSIDQLMELAGYSVACATHDFFQSQIRPASEQMKDSDKSPTVMIWCGPGNNGGDGLVAARHLKHFGYNPTVLYPKKSSGQLFDNLVTQLQQLDIPIRNQDQHASLEEMDESDIVIDALFGFSFKGPARQPFRGIIQNFTLTKTPVLSVDIPSGWDVDTGDLHTTGFTPDAVISLTLPKHCMERYEKVHYIGGRFMPPSLAQELQVTLPDYGFGTNQILLLQGSGFIPRKTKTIPILSPQIIPVLEDEIASMFVTASSEEEAKRIAQHLILQKLVACVNLIPSVQSIYEWEGKVESSQEILMMIKTRRSLTSAVTAAIKSLHSYTVPESIVVNIESQGSNIDYLKWVLDSTVTK